MIEHSYICSMIPVNHWSRGVGNDIKKKNKKNNLKESGVLYFTLGVGKVKKSQKWSENQTCVWIQTQDL